MHTSAHTQKTSPKETCIKSNTTTNNKQKITMDLGR